MVSVVVSIRMRKMFAAVRKMFVKRDGLSRIFVKGGPVGTSKCDSCSYEAA